MSRDTNFARRLHQAGLSRWELADLLGLHPHELELSDHPAAMNGQPVRVVADLAARLDLHPADLADALDPVLAIQRVASTGDTTECDPHQQPEPANGAHAGAGDAMVVLTALATTSVPLSLDELSTALDWPLDRTAAALDHARRHRELSGPLT